MRVRKLSLSAARALDPKNFPPGYAREILDYGLRAEGTERFAAYDGDELVGLMSLCEHRSELRVYALCSFRKGAGWKLLSFAARRAGRSDLVLRVLSDLSAVEYYKRRGFRRGRRDGNVVPMELPRGALLSSTT